MNAKSLSTILHFKGTTEKIVEERDHLATQMENASRARDRVSEELLKEKNSLDLRRIALEEQLLTTDTELNRNSIEWANAISSKDTERTNVRQRCNQLVEENERYREEARNS